MRNPVKNAGRKLRRSSFCLVTASALVSGCTALTPIENQEPVAKGLSYQAEYRTPTDDGRRWSQTARHQNRNRCTDAGAVSGAASANIDATPAETVLLSAGDLVSVMVGTDPAFSGTYEISHDGTLSLPHLPAIRAQGRAADAIERDLRNALVSGGIYNTAPSVSVRLQDFSSARIFVSGAVFNAGAVSIGGISATDRDNLRQEAVGGTGESRRLSRALQTAGGIRPDADLSRVRIIRGDKTIVIDARPAMDGRPYNDMMLLAGDHVEVGSRGCFQDDLVKPSPLTTPGVKVFMSNLTQPAASNANSAVGKEARELRYGTRFLDAIVGMNCLGGTKLVNANRTAALISRNPMTGESVVIERRVEELLRSADRDDFNPFMMPEDALACYDSSVTNIFDVAKGFSSVAAAAALLSL